MAECPRLLILGGTGEAAELAERAADMFAGKIAITYSLAGRIGPERNPAPGVRVGGFGGLSGLADYLRSEKIDLLIDATHPFAATISASAHGACVATGTPRLALVRPPWPTPSGAGFMEADDMADAVRLLSPIARRVFATTGQSGLDAAAMAPAIHFIVRVIERPDGAAALDNCTLIGGRPPYSVENERALIREHGVDALLAKQSGGRATVAKITAATTEGIAIVLLRRPPPPPGERVESVAAALEWLRPRVAG